MTKNRDSCLDNDPHTGRAIASTQVGWLLLGGLGFRSAIAIFLPPGFDEAYYFLYTRHLDWSYFDHPLAVALSTGLGVWLTGVVSPLTIRIGALGLYTISLWLLYETGRWLFNARVGWLSCLMASLSPLFLLTFGTLTAPDSALIAFWSTALYVCAREFFPQGSVSEIGTAPAAESYEPTAKLAIAGGLIGLCCLSKYHGALLGLSLVGFCLSSREHRSALTSRWMVLGIAFFSLCLLPIVVWNAQHDWISFQFQLSDRFNDKATGFSLTNFLGVFLTGTGFLFPTLGCPLWWVSLSALFSTHWPRSNRQILEQQQPQASAKRVQFLLWSGLPVAASFTILGGLIHTYPAWPAPGLWPLTLLLGHAATRWPTRLVSRWLRGTGWTVGTILLFALAHITLGTLQQPSQNALFGGFIAPRQDPSTALIDVGQLRKKFEHSEDFQAAIATTDFMLTHEFWLSGYVAMALSKVNRNLSVGSFTPDPRGHAIWFDSQQWVGKDALFVNIEDFSQKDVVSAIAPYFQSVTLLTQLTTERGNAITETFYLYRASQLTKPYPYPY